MRLNLLPFGLVVSLGLLPSILASPVSSPQVPENVVTKGREDPPLCLVDNDQFVPCKSIEHPQIPSLTADDGSFTGDRFRKREAPKSNIAYVLVPGALHIPAHYEDLGARLAKSHNAAVSIARHPSIRLDSPFPGNLTSDTGAVAGEILKLVDEGRDVVVVMHSYGGLPGSAAVEGLDVDTRKAAGRKGGVKACVYVSALALDRGKSFEDVVGDVGDLQWVEIVNDPSGASIAQAAPSIREFLYNDVEPSVADWAISITQRMNLENAASKAPFAAWKRVPSTYVVLENDKAIPPDLQRFFTAQEGGLWTVKNVQSGHMPMLNAKVEELVRIIGEAAGVQG